MQSQHISQLREFELCLIISSSSRTGGRGGDHDARKRWLGRGCEGEPSSFFRLSSNANPTETAMCFH